MGLIKTTYVDGETIIHSDNLNAIQDQIIENTTNIDTKQNISDSNLVTSAKTVVGGINELKNAGYITGISKQDVITALNFGTVRTSSTTWGTVNEGNSYSVLCSTDQPGGGGITVGEKSGQTSIQVDGTLYVDEGRYVVINSSTIGSQSVSYATSSGSSNTTNFVGINTGNTSLGTALGTWAGPTSASGFKYDGGYAYKQKYTHSSLSTDTADWGIAIGTYSSSGGLGAGIYSDGGFYTLGHIATTSGNMYAVSFVSSSDRNLKENFEKIGNVDLMNLSAYKYNFKFDIDKTAKIGLIAQDVQKICPEAVSINKLDTPDEFGLTEHLSLDYNSIVSLLVNKVNELEKRIIELEKKE